MNKIRIAISAMIAITMATGMALLATPAFAAPSSTPATLVLDVTTDITPGQTINATIVDTGGNICQASMVGELWAPYLNILDSMSNVVGSAYASMPAGVYAAGQTWNAALTVAWLNTEVDTTTPTQNGDYTLQAGCQDSPESNQDLILSAAVAIEYRPISFSAMSVEQGSSVDITVADATGTWCGETAGAGYSMGIGLTPNDGGDTIFVPTAIGSGPGTKGVGDFTWNDTTATASLTVPTTVPAGTYSVFVGCISSEGDGFLQPGPGMTMADFVVTAPAPVLAATGVDVGSSGSFVLLLTIAGFLLVGLRRHRLANS